MRWALALLALAVALPAERKLELQGRIEPPQKASVTIFGSYTPFTASTRADASGRFRFRNLAPGTYTLSVYAPGRGEVRQTVEVSARFADSKSRVPVTIAFRPSPESVLETGRVSARELAVPANAKKEFERAQAKLSENDVAAGIRHLERAVALAPRFAMAWNQLGTIAYQSRRFPDAEKYFRKALEADPAAYSPLVNLGGVLINLGKLQEALEYNRRAVEARPDDALANSQLGTNYMLLGNEDRALEYLNTAKRLDPSHFSNPQLFLAAIYARRGERAQAIAELEDFLKRHPDAPNAANVRAEIEKLRK